MFDDVKELDDLKPKKDKPMDVSREITKITNELRSGRHDPEKSMDNIEKSFAYLLSCDLAPRDRMSLHARLMEYHKMLHGSRERDMRVDTKNLNLNLLSDDARKMIADRTGIEIKADE